MLVHWISFGLHDDISRIGSLIMSYVLLASSEQMHCFMIHLNNGSFCASIDIASMLIFCSPQARLISFFI
jgi:hypothetical protein